MNEKIKKFLKYIGTGCLSLIIFYLSVIFLFYVISIFDKRTPEQVWHQYCIEDGDCKEGEVLIHEGKTIVITKEFCLENNYEWREDYKFCKTSYNEPWKVNSCLEKGGCWDYIRHRCEKKDQGFCARNEKDCTERQGIWQEDKKYCDLKDK